MTNANEFINVTPQFVIPLHKILDELKRRIYCTHRQLNNVL